ncbi:hypothetical protein I5U65_02305 [Stenotrophomonas maltophilia]|nr:hypothetical protein [Stenotrophomonas maltophilia]
MEHIFALVEQFAAINPAACAIFVLALCAFAVVWKVLHILGKVIRHKDDK